MLQMLLPLTKSFFSFSSGLKFVSKTTGLVGVALGSGLAIYDMYENGVNWNNLTSLGLGILAGAILVTPGIGELAEGVSLAVDAATLTNDVISITTEKH